MNIPSHQLNNNKLKKISTLPTAINTRAPNRSKMGPTWIPTKKTMNR